MVISLMVAYLLEQLVGIPKHTCRRRRRTIKMSENMEHNEYPHIACPILGQDSISHRSVCLPDNLIGACMSAAAGLQQSVQVLQVLQLISSHISHILLAEPS
jgi:hypothetical protein